MTVTYSPAPEAETIGNTLVAQIHTPLADVEMRYLFRSEPAQRGGQSIWGDAKKVSGLNAYLAHQNGPDAELLDHEDAGEVSAEPFFAIVIALPVWTILDGPTREALLDHLLSRCRVEDSENGVRLSIASPEAAEFVGVMARRGMWRDALRKLVGAAYKTHPTLFDKETLDGLLAKDEDEQETDDELDPRMPDMTIMPNGGRWEGTCPVHGVIHIDDVRAVVQRRVDEHLAEHQAALDDGEGGESFGSEFDAKVAELEAEESERHLKSVAR